VHIVFAEFLSISFFIFCATLRVLDILIISLIIFCGVFAVICVIAIFCALLALFQHADVLACFQRFCG
jgi:hypothetical protein